MPFTPRDNAMELRLKRQLMALVSYLMFLLPLAYSVRYGWAGLSAVGLAVFAGIAIAVNAFFFLLIRSGYTRRFRDPSMTFVQVLISLVMGLSLIHYTQQARPVMLMLFVASLFFGIFALRRRQFWFLAVVTIIAYGFIIGAELRSVPADSDLFHLSVLQFLALTMIMCWMAGIGGYVANLRTRLYDQKGELSAAVERLNQLVSYDELTGVFNRRHLLEILEHEKQCADRYKYTFSLCILDIDHFKSINDAHGHQIGDEVLREFSSRMRAKARKMDWLGRGVRADPDEPATDVSFGRYGGEEFLVVMPHATATDARQGVERMREGIQSTAISTTSGDLEVRFSAGIAEYVAGETIDATIARADRALYRAKENGRNNTQVDGQLPSQ